MNCGKCGKEMVSIGEPQMVLQEVKEEGKTFPTKVICFLYHFFGCKDCQVKSSQAELKEYFEKKEE